MDTLIFGSFYMECASGVLSGDSVTPKSCLLLYLTLDFFTRTLHSIF